VAKQNANNPTDFDLKMNMFGSTSGAEENGDLNQGGLSEEMGNSYGS
jgi:hypothetical protein